MHPSLASTIDIAAYSPTHVDVDPHTHTRSFVRAKFIAIRTPIPLQLQTDGLPPKVNSGDAHVITLFWVIEWVDRCALYMRDP